MACHGLPVDSLRKNVVSELLTRDLSESMRQIVELRQELDRALWRQGLPASEPDAPR
jgi:hypothetical protein